MEKDELGLKSIVSMLRRRIRLIVVAMALSVAVAFVVLTLVTPVFTATTLVMVETGARTLLYDDERIASGSSDNARIESEVEILRSPSIALAVVRNESLVTDPEFGPSLSLADKILKALGLSSSRTPTGEQLVQGVLARFSNAVSINRLGQTHLIGISVTSESPERAAELANGLAETYIEAKLQSKIEGSLRGRDALQRQIATAQAALIEFEEEIDLFIDRNLERIEAETGREDVARLRQLLGELSGDRLATDVQLRESEQALERQNWAALSTRLGDEALMELQRQREAVERRLAGTPAGSAQEIDLRTALAELEAEQAQVAETTIGELRIEMGGLASSMRETRAQLRDTVLRGELPPQMLSELYQLQQEASIARTQYQTLLSRIRELEVQAAVQMADSRVVSPALPPRLASAPNRRLVLPLALVLGLGLGVGLALTNEYFLGGVTSEDQLRDLLKADGVTTVPLVTLKQDVERSIADTLISAPLSALSESIRRLRASLELRLREHRNDAAREGADSPGACIVVASSIPAEGKTTIALALARAFATSGKSVLLIDADLRVPTMHEQVGVKTETGLIDYLTDPQLHEVNDRMLSQDTLSQANVIPGRGHAFQQTDHLIASDVFSDLIKASQEAFDIVVIDTPPLLPVVDARYIVPFADAVVMVTRFASTTQSDLRRAAQTLHEVMPQNTEFLGVLNQEPQTQAGYHYARYYGG